VNGSSKHSLLFESKDHVLVLDKNFEEVLVQETQFYSVIDIVAVEYRD
jgi:hypothetical protein